MNKRTKMILSIIGVAAVVVPAVLLLIATSKTKEVPAVPTQEREIDAKNIQETSKKLVPSQPPAPSAATSSGSPFKSKESTKSSGTNQ